MAFFQKLGIMFKYWDADEAPAITMIFRLILLAMVAAMAYGIWRIAT